MKPKMNSQLSLAGEFYRTHLEMNTFPFAVSLQRCKFLESQGLFKWEKT